MDLLLAACDCVSGNPCSCHAHGLVCKCSPLWCSCEDSGHGVRPAAPSCSNGTKHDDSGPAVAALSMPAALVDTVRVPPPVGPTDSALLNNLQPPVLEAMRGSVARALGAHVVDNRVIVPEGVFPGCETDQRRARRLLAPRRAIENHASSLAMRLAGDTRNTASEQLGARWDELPPPPVPFWIRTATTGTFPPPPVYVALAAFLWWGGVGDGGADAERPLSWRALCRILTAWVAEFPTQFDALSASRPLPRKRNGAVAWASHSQSITKDLVRLVLRTAYDPSAQRIFYFLSWRDDIAAGVQFPAPPVPNTNHCEQTMFSKCAEVALLVLDSAVTLHQNKEQKS
jgi:hypothetical protein